MNSPAPSKALRKATAYHEAGRITDARRLYQSVLQDEPRNPVANHGLGLLAIAQGRLDAAIPYLTTALQSDPKQPRHWLSFVEALILMGRAGDARAILAKGIATGLSGPDVAALQRRLTHLELFQRAVEHHRSGRLSEARQIYTTILRDDPHHADSLHMAGVLGFQTGHADIGVELIGKAIQIKPGVAAFHCNLGNALQARGQTTDAEHAFRRALELDPSDPEAHSGLAGILQSQQQLDGAMALYEKALRLKPDHAVALNNIGNIFKTKGQPDRARDHYERAVSIDPGYAFAHNNLGNLLRATGNFDEAIDRFQKAVGLAPDFAEAHYNLGLTLLNAGRPQEARAYLERSIELQPSFPDALFALGNLHETQGDLDTALNHYKTVIDGGIKTANALCNTGVIFFARGRYHEAIAYLLAALREDPERVDVHNNLGNALHKVGQIESAIAHYREALRIRPDYAEALANLAGALQTQGKVAEAIANYEAAIRAKPDLVLAHSNLLMLLGYSADVPHGELVARAKAFDERFAAPLLRKRTLANTPDPDRRLRIGYVSGDFRNHAVNYFFEPLLTQHDHRGFEIFAYSSSLMEDAVTERLKAKADVWRDVSVLDDEKTADLIEGDAIDILVDLSGHMAANRLLVFARKPAPVQATWLGFTTTTGLGAIDYRISDNYCDPPGMTEHYNVEKLWRLPGAFCCYQATTRDIVAIDHPPRDDNGYVTFGCFNNFAKVNDGTLRRWAEILARVPDARLLLEIVGIDSEDMRRAMETWLQRMGLPANRVILEPRSQQNQFVLYNKVDIALDPFPFNGGTTTMDALWMGVPVVTLAGEYFTSRMGVTIMTNAGLPEMIASTEDEYTDIAVRLATDRGSLDAARRDLRNRVAASRMMDHARFARDMEDAFRGMWRLWCAQQAPN